MDLKLFLRIRFGDEKTGKGFNSLFNNASLRGHLDNTKKNWDLGVGKGQKRSCQHLDLEFRQLSIEKKH
jgi:hypothetical protein